MNAATHPIAPEEVMALLDGELSADRISFVAAHVNECKQCSQIRDSLRHALQSLTAWTVPDVSADIQQHMLNSSTTAKSLVKHGFAPSWRRFASRRAVLASAIGFVLLLVFFGLSSTRYDKSISRSAIEQDIPVDNAAPMASPSRVPLREHGRNSVGRADAKDSQYYVHRIPFQERPVPPSSDAGILSPMIARTVSLSIVVKDFDAGRASLDAILARHNGYAASLNVSTPQGSARTLQASLRIPAPQLAQALSELKTLGRVENENQNGEEVTQQHADLVVRLKNSRETELRLQDVLRTRTGKVKDVLEVEEEIARVRGEIEQLEAEQKTLEHRVEFATIDLKLAEEYKAQLNTPAPSVLMQLRNATINGFRNAFESLLALVLFLAESGPSLLLWLALLGIPAWRLWRRYRRAPSLGSLARA
jgi:uncharacterized protein DUF4349